MTTDEVLATLQHLLDQTYLLTPVEARAVQRAREAVARDAELHKLAVQAAKAEVTNDG